MIYIGTSGYYFKHWKKKFYKTNKFLEEYSEYFNSVEINNTFYRLQSKKSIENLLKYDLKYSFKINRYFRSYVKNNVTKAKISWMRQYKSLGSLSKESTFILQFDSNTKASIKLINNIMKCISRRVKLVIEGRNETWTEEIILKKLKRHNIPLVILPENAIFNQDYNKVLKYNKLKVIYIRFHGLKKYGGNYSSVFLRKWSKIIKSFKGHEIYVYFNNDENAYAPFNALELSRLLK